MNVDEYTTFISNWVNDKKCDDVRRMCGAFEGDNFLGFVGASFTEKEDAEHGVELNYLFVKRQYRGKSLVRYYVMLLIYVFMLMQCG